MKTKILSIILLFAAIAGISKSTYAATSNSAGYTILNNIKEVNKIEIHGNVELFISDSPVEQVRVYNKYYSENAFVQSDNGILRISSYNAEKLVVWVSADDLSSVSVYDNAEVKSFGPLSKIEFNVDLHDTASANLKLDAYSANVRLSDHAKVELIGAASEFNINHDTGSVVTNNDFSADHYHDIKIGEAGQVKSDVLTILE